LLAREQAQEILTGALAASRADETEVTLGGGRLHVVALEEGRLRENRSETWFELRVRAHVKGRVGLARTNRLDEASVRAAVLAAGDAARVAPPWPGLLPLPGPVTYPEDPRFDQEVEDLPASARLAYVAPLLLDARRHGARAGGVFAARAGSLGLGGSPGLLAIANSRGLFVFDRTTRLRLEARVLAGQGSGWAEGEHWRVRSFEPAPVVARALAKALAAREIKPLGSGRYDVVLEPAAVATFLRTIAPHFSARAVDQGWSYLRGREGRGITRGNITLVDDFSHPLHRGSPFDGEGVPRRQVPLIVHGIVRGLVYSREMARREGVPPSGHAPLQPARGDALPTHLVLHGEERTTEDLIATTERGILVTRLWAHRVLDPARAVCTGTTRDGTYWIEGGKVRHALADLRYEMGAFDVLAQVAALSRPERALGVVAPAVKVREFRILGVEG
jgi:predicted Zn-dependent protease